MAGESGSGDLVLMMVDGRFRWIYIVTEDDVPDDSEPEQQQDVDES